jgi:hypothetical protein
VISQSYGFISSGQIKKLNHRDLKGTELIFLSFSAIILSNNDLLEKHWRFSKRSLLLRKPGDETADGLSFWTIHG